ncbi:DUF4282 domain-containing protein [Myceligenerans xiligouense]|uniref:DUF308 domain-containing protein n=1 Tax=Myceligenerans xiligouense TaxID=253184 RepID=A0A3N4ZIY0_9MICO|nr:DUF4282 domain-containing protein [Myceligenerans xiligouense]RPF20845.1 hypothetical protein EDD34_1452 [Myceligenerans xiligouense]
MAASNTDDRDDDLPDEPTPPADRSEDAGPETNDRTPDPGELADETVDARFADLVASLGDLGAGPATRTSVPESPEPQVGLRRAGTHPDPDDDDHDADVADAPATPTPPTPPARASGPRDWPVTPEVAALEEADSHFTPPEPEPLLSDKDPLLTMAWIAVAVIPVLALVSVIAVAAIPALSIPALVGQVALGLFVAGLGVLLWRMPHRRDPEDDDPGAVV